VRAEPPQSLFEEKAVEGKRKEKKGIGKQGRGGTVAQEGKLTVKKIEKL